MKKSYFKEFEFEFEGNFYSADGEVEFVDADISLVSLDIISIYNKINEEWDLEISRYGNITEFLEFNEDFHDYVLEKFED